MRPSFSTQLLPMGSSHDLISWPRRWHQSWRKTDLLMTWRSIVTPNTYLKWDAAQLVTQTCISISTFYRKRVTYLVKPIKVFLEWVTTWERVTILREARIGSNLGKPHRVGVYNLWSHLQSSTFTETDRKKVYLRTFLTSPDPLSEQTFLQTTKHRYVYSLPWII